MSCAKHINSNLSIRPDGLGTLLFILSIVIPFRYDFSQKALILSAILAIFSFYTKAYYITGWYAMSFALLFIHWRRFLLGNLQFHLLLLLSAYGVSKIFPLYFYETIFAYNHEIGSIEYSISQFLRSVKILSPILVLCLIGVIGYLRSDNRQKKLFLPPSIISLAAIIAIIIYPLGTNDGAYLTYHSQLLAPMLSIAVLQFSPSPLKNDLYLTALSLLFIFSVYKTPFVKRPSEAKDSWQIIQKEIASSHMILNSPPTSALLQVFGKDVTDDGVTIFHKTFEPKKITSTFFGYDEEIENRIEIYTNSIKSKIIHHDYDCAILNEHDSWYRLCLENGYVAKKTVTITLACNWDYTLSILKPSTSPNANSTIQH